MGSRAFGVGEAKQKQTSKEAAEKATAAGRRTEQWETRKEMWEVKQDEAEEHDFGYGDGESIWDATSCTLHSRDDLRCLLRPVRDCIDRLLDPSPLEAEPDIAAAVVASVLVGLRFFECT